MLAVRAFCQCTEPLSLSTAQASRTLLLCKAQGLELRFGGLCLELGVWGFRAYVECSIQSLVLRCSVLEV